MAKKQHKARAEAAVNGNALQVSAPTKNAKGIRPTLYNEFVIVKVEKMASQGYNNRQICVSLGIAYRTFYEWLDRYPQLSHALKKYRGLADIEVENALYRNAVGYTYKEQALTNRGAVVTINKYHTGNSTAQIFYLKNRMPERYKDKIETVLSLAEDVSQMAFMIKRREE